MTVTTFLDREVLKQTHGRCPVCHKSVQATVWLDPLPDSKLQRVMLTRTCPEHGETTNCISSDARFYWLSKGDPANAGECCAGAASCDGVDGFLGSNAFSPKDEPLEKLSTCLALIEIVDSCNLRCPTCYADSPHGVGDGLVYTPIDQLKTRIQGAIDRKGGLEILQLSGGEPTLHPDFFELLEWCVLHKGIDYVLINTNGVKLASGNEFTKRLKEVFAYGKTQLYLQFDGVQEAGQAALRGIDLRKTKEQAIEAAGEINLPVTLAMTVTGVNAHHLWEAVRFGLEFKNVRGISFQPMFFSWRIHQGSPKLQDLMRSRLNTADIILNLVGQSSGNLKFEDFTPLPCGDPNCATIGYLLKFGDTVKSVSDFVDFSEIQGFLKDRVRYSPEDLAKCGCESEPLGKLLH